MSEENNNQQVPANVPAPEKSGCMTWVGILLLIAAVAAVLWFFIAKPALEEKGVDVQQEFENVKNKTGEAVSSVKNKLSSTKEKISDKYGDLQEKVEEINESETVEKIKDGAGKVKDSGKEIVVKAKEGESWY